MCNMTDLSAVRPQRRPDVEMEVMPDGSALLFDPQTEQGHVLIPFAGLVWDMCDGTLTVADIHADLAQLLPTTPDLAATVQALLTEFAELGLLETGAVEA